MVGNQHLVGYAAMRRRLSSYGAISGTYKTTVRVLYAKWICRMQIADRRTGPWEANLFRNQQRRRPLAAVCVCGACGCCLWLSAALAANGDCDSSEGLLDVVVLDAQAPESGNLIGCKAIKYNDETT